MAGNSSIGKLNVIIGADADGAVKGIEKIEKRIAGFKAKALQIPNALMSSTSGIMGQAQDIVKDTMKLIGGGASLFSGGENWAKKIGLLDFENWEESAHRGIDLFKQINRVSQFHGVTPQFAQTIMFLAGDDADAAVNVIDKIAMAQAKLAAGDQATADALKPFLDIERFANGDTEQGIRQVADALKDLATHSGKMGLGEALAGKKGAGRLLELLGGGNAKIDAGGNMLEENGALVGDVGPAARIAKYLELKDKAEQTALDNERGLIKLASKKNLELFNEGKIGHAQYLQTVKALRPLSPLAVFGGGMGGITGVKFAEQFLKEKDPGFKNALVGGKTPDYKDKAQEIIDAAKADAYRTEQLRKDQETLKVIAGTRSPLEQYQESVKQLRGLNLTRDQVWKAEDKAFAQAFGTDSAIAQAKQQFGMQNAYRANNPLAAGSQDLQSAISESLGSKDVEPTIEELVDLAERNIDEQQKAYTQREEINRRLAARAEDKSYAIPPA